MTLLEQAQEAKEYLHAAETAMANAQVAVNELVESIRRANEAGPSIFDVDADPTSDIGGVGGE